MKKITFYLNTWTKEILETEYADSLKLFLKEKLQMDLDISVNNYRFSIYFPKEIETLIINELSKLGSYDIFKGSIKIESL
jgi:hypothetical protein